MSAAVIGILTAAIGATVSAVSGGVSGGLQGAANKRNAERLEQNITVLKDRLERQEISKGEALKRLNTMIKQVGGELRATIGKSISDAIQDYTTEYEKALRIGTQKISDAMIMNRMGASEANIAAQTKIGRDLGEQYTESVGDIRAQGLDKMFAALTALKAQGFGAGEEIIKDYENFEITMDKEILELDSMADTLSGQGWGKLAGAGFLAGGASGLENIAQAILGATYDPQGQGKGAGWQPGDWLSKQKDKRTDKMDAGSLDFIGV